MAAGQWNIWTHGYKKFYYNLSKWTFGKCIKYARKMYIWIENIHGVIFEHNAGQELKQMIGHTISNLMSFLKQCICFSNPRR